MNRMLPIILCLALGLQSALAQTLPGFTSTDAEAQLQLEQDLIGRLKPETFRAHLEALTREPHIAGSPENLRVARYMAQAMEDAGLTSQMYPYDIYLPQGPGDIEVELVTPIRRPLNHREYILPEDSFSAHPDLAPGWNAYSGSGEVTAEVVYANYGRKEDFERLAALGVPVQGKIVIARYGGNFRGYKAKFAEAAGAAGLIIYTDPQDAGYVRGLTYPEGPYYNESTIQRGSVLTLDYTGDPLTPFEPALPTDGDVPVERLDPSEVQGFHSIPVTPLPYGSAQEILERMRGAPVPSGWQGGLPFTYRLTGGQDLSVRLKVEQPRELTRVQNVIGTLPGSLYPDEWIILGCHFDAWSFGATDPNSGTAMLLTLADALGELAREGQRPARSILIAHWDAEEFGILGSTEWVEQLREELNAKAIAYFNADGACTGLRFGASSSPSLKELLTQATRVVPYPDGEQTVYDHWVNQREGATEPRIGNLGGGSDHLPFYVHLGIPALGVNMGGPTLYHSGYDDFHFYSQFSDPDFVSGPTVAGVLGVMSLRLANAKLLPLDIDRYGHDLVEHLQTAEKQIQSYAPNHSLAKLKAQAQQIAEQGAALEQELSALLAQRSRGAINEMQLNQALRDLEKAFIDEQGMAYGTWYRSLYASSDPYSGYASWMLPGLLYEASLQSTERLPEWEKRYATALSDLLNRIEALRRMVARR